MRRLLAKLSDAVSTAGSYYVHIPTTSLCWTGCREGRYRPGTLLFTVAASYQPGAPFINMD